MISETPLMSETPRTETDLVLVNADWVVACDEKMNCIPHASVVVHEGAVVDVGPAERVRERYAGRKEMDLEGFLLLPGLVNTHTHAAMSCFRGLGDDLPLARWLFEVIFPAEAANVSPELVYWGTLLSSVEMLLGGTTTFCDGYFFEENAVRAARDAGIRAVLGQGVLDFPTPDQPDPSRFIETAEAFLESFPADTPRLRPSLFCHAPYTCGAKTLVQVKKICRERGILFQMHLAETAGEAREALQKYGEPTVFYLDRLGLLDESSLFAHAVWLEPSEIELLARRGACVSHNPESNMKLASGTAPVPELLAAGVRLGLGTDGCASNNNLDLFSEMDKAAKLHKAVRLDPEICPARAALAMATRGGATALGWGNEIGVLAPGMRADIVAVDLDQPHLTPIYDPVSHLVYAVKASDVRHVWVDGRLAVLDREVQGVNIGEAMARVKEIAGKIRTSGGARHVIS